MISIITPVYNGERFIEFCIKNVIEQNCPEAEHVIVDGGSQDATVDIVRHYAKKYRHIRWISEKDRGQSDALNKGTNMARGEIIGILNVDDYYEADTLNSALQIFKSLPEPSLLVGKCSVWNDDGSLHYVNTPKRISLRNILLERFSCSFPCNPVAYFYHASLHHCVGGYSLDQQYAMDLDFILKALRIAKVTYVDRVMGNFRYHKETKTYRNTVSGNNIANRNAMLKYYRKQLRQPVKMIFYAEYGTIRAARRLLCLCRSIWQMLLAP